MNKDDGWPSEKASHRTDKYANGFAPSMMETFALVLPLSSNKYCYVVTTQTGSSFCSHEMVIVAHLQPVSV